MVQNKMMLVWPTVLYDSYRFSFPYCIDWYWNVLYRQFKRFVTIILHQRSFKNSVFFICSSKMKAEIHWCFALSQARAKKKNATSSFLTNFLPFRRNGQHAMQWWKEIILWEHDRWMIVLLSSLWVIGGYCRQSTIEFKKKKNDLYKINVSSKKAIVRLLLVRKEWTLSLKRRIILEANTSPRQITWSGANCGFGRVSLFVWQKRWNYDSTFSHIDLDFHEKWYVLTFSF